MAERTKLQLSKNVEPGETLFGRLKYFDVFDGQYGLSAKLVMTGVEIVDSDTNETREQYDEADVWVTGNVGGKIVAGGAATQKSGSKGDYYQVNNDVEVAINKIQTDRGISYTVEIEGQEITQVEDLVVTKGKAAAAAPRSTGRAATRGAAGAEGPARVAVDPKLFVRRAKASMIAAHLLGKQLNEQGFPVTEGQVTAFFIEFQRNGIDLSESITIKKAPEPTTETPEPAAGQAEEPKPKPTKRPVSSRAKAVRSAGAVRDAIDKAADDLQEKPKAIQQEEEEELPF